MSLRLGFVHVPKCGGTSVANAIFAAFGMESFHIAHLRNENEAWGPHDVIRHHVSYRLARAVPFLSGHITYSDMQDLGRNMIFTVLRDPYAAALSRYTYNVGRAHDPKILARRPHLEPYKHITLSEHLDTATPAQFLISLGRDVFSEKEIINVASKGVTMMDENPIVQKKIDRALRRFDMVLGGGQLSQQMKIFSKFIDADEITIEHHNRSKETLPTPLGASRQVIIEKLVQLCWLDEYVYARCERFFPETMLPLVPDAEKTFDAFVKRFQPSGG
ncbi:hypothetical protein ACEWPM_018435 [Roseovarius sp. S4756]|uniref:hypothetical protein n=1 Tax=Roseovarius maritimus TaxID=3342637 RepID=UPI003B67BACD